MLERRLFLVLAILAGAAPAAAHEVRPGFLQIREIEPATYDVLWKTPARGNMRLALNVILPPSCRTVGQVRKTLVEGAALQRWRSACDGGLPGEQIAIENLEASLTDVIVHFEPLSGAPKTLHLDGAAPIATIPERQSVWEVARSYFHLGIEHILWGIDHLLFVLCLLLLVRNLRVLLGAVTAFTVAHSITLAATTFGWIQLAIAPVEACIALSIAFVAAEIIRARKGRSAAPRHWSWVAAFSFGLLHGFGFASALRDIGLPEGAVPAALLFFNLGVEAGQILFVCVVLMVTFLWRTYVTRPPALAWRTTPYVAGVLACYWFIERTARIFT